MKISEFEQTVITRMAPWVIVNLVMLVVILVLYAAGEVFTGSILALVALAELGFGHGWETRKLSDERGGRISYPAKQ